MVQYFLLQILWCWSLCVNVAVTANIRPKRTNLSAIERSLPPNIASHGIRDGFVVATITETDEPPSPTPSSTGFGDVKGASKVEEISRESDCPERLCSELCFSWELCSDGSTVISDFGNYTSRYQRTYYVLMPWSGDLTGTTTYMSRLNDTLHDLDATSRIRDSRLPPRSVRCDFPTSTFETLSCAPPSYTLTIPTLIAYLGMGVTIITTTIVPTTSCPSATADTVAPEWATETTTITKTTWESIFQYITQTVTVVEAVAHMAAAEPTSWDSGAAQVNTMAATLAARQFGTEIIDPKGTEIPTSTAHEEKSRVAEQSGQTTPGTFEPYKPPPALRWWFQEDIVNGTCPPTDAGITPGGHGVHTVVTRLTSSVLVQVTKNQIVTITNHPTDGPNLLVAAPTQGAEIVAPAPSLGIPTLTDSTSILEADVASVQAVPLVAVLGSLLIVALFEVL